MLLRRPRVASLATPAGLRACELTAVGSVGAGSVGEAQAVAAHEADLAAYALERLAEVPGITIFGPRELPRGPAISFAIEGVHPHDVAEILGRDGVCVRAGHHCTQPLMRRLGVPATSRASFAVHNTRADVDRLIEGLGQVRRVFALD